MTNIDDLERIIDFRFKHTYAMTLDNFEFMPRSFMLKVYESLQKGIISEDNIEQLFTMEKDTLGDFYLDVHAGLSKRMPHGAFLSKINAAHIVEIMLETAIKGYEEANREGKIDLIRENVINYKIDDEGYNGPFRFFSDNCLRGFLQQCKFLRKKGSPLAAIELYDEVLKLGLFDKSEEKYLGRWEISEIGMWQGDESTKLVSEAVEDVLWKITGYRYSSRNKKIELIRKCVINYKTKTKFAKKNGILQFLSDYGLGGMIHSYFKHNIHPYSIFQIYDQQKGLQLFDANYDVHLAKREFQRKE